MTPSLFVDVIGMVNIGVELCLDASYGRAR